VTGPSGPARRAKRGETARRVVARFDAAVDRRFDRLRGRTAADRILYAASELGDFSLLWLLIGSARSMTSERNERAFLRLAAVLAVESLLVNGLIKSALPRRRPQWPEGIGARPFRLRTPRTASFPSGHASAGFTAASLFADDGGPWVGMYGLATVVAASRIHVKIHHASDVLAGAALGFAFGRIARRAWVLEDSGERIGDAPRLTG